MKRPRHLEFIRSLGCLVCGDDTTTEAAHIRSGCRMISKPITGMGIKPPDWYVVPLCGKHHREQHKIDEHSFWAHQTLASIADVITVALALYAHTGDLERCQEIAKSWRQ